MHQISILVVEDDPNCRDVVRRALAVLGHRVTTANDGAEALRLCSTGGAPFDIILMDARMPVMDGHEAVRQLKDHEMTKTIPIISYSATDRIEGCDAYLRKPASMKELRLTIEETLASRGKP